MKTRNIEINEEAIRAFCQKHGIRRLSLFGSVLRDDFGPDSDVDILIEFAPGRVVGLITFMGLQQEISDIVGRTVDLRTAEELSPYFRNEVLAEQEPVYVETQ